MNRAEFAKACFKAFPELDGSIGHICFGDPNYEDSHIDFCLAQQPTKAVDFMALILLQIMLQIPYTKDCDPDDNPFGFDLGEFDEA